VQLLRLCSILSVMLAASGALAADADNGRRLAEMRCVTCHIVSPRERRVVTDAPPFEAIARKFASNPDTLAFSIINPHPRMNVTLTRREAQDVAACINTLAKESTCASNTRGGSSRVKSNGTDRVDQRPRPAPRRSGAHWFGLGVFGGAVRLIMVLQLRHENVSNCALFSSDLLLSIASPQSGQCRIGGRGGAGIRATV